MTDMQPYRGIELLIRDMRWAGRTISRSQAGGQLRMAGVDIATDLALTKVDSLTTVTGQTMGAVVRVAQAQNHLEQLAPEASGRLAMLADDHVLGLAEISADHRRTLRRS